MSLPKRNRQKVRFNGIDFHWVKGSRGVTVQHASGKGARLMIDPFGPVFYDVIPSAIEFALKRDWEPMQSGPPFWIGYRGISDPRYQFVLRKASDPPFWRDPRRMDFQYDPN